MSTATPIGVGWNVEYSDEVPPTPASTWNKVGGVRSVQWNPVAAPDIDVTDTDSTEQLTKTGLGGPGTFDVSGDLIALATSNQVEVMDTLQNGTERHWRITAAKGVSTSSSGLVHIFTGTVQTASYGVAGYNSEATMQFTVRVNSTTSITAES